MDAIFRFQNCLLVLKKSLKYFERLAFVQYILTIIYTYTTTTKSQMATTTTTQLKISPTCRGGYVRRCSVTQISVTQFLIYDVMMGCSTVHVALVVALPEDPIQTRGQDDHRSKRGETAVITYPSSPPWEIAKE